MSQNLKGFLIVDQDLDINTDPIPFAVEAGGLATWQQYSANTQQASSISATCQFPNKSVITSRNALVTSEIAFTINIGAGTASGQPCLVFGSNISLQSFSLHRLINVSQCTLNNSQNSATISQILDVILKSYKAEDVAAYNSMTPSKIDDTYFSYTNAVGATNNPMESIVSADLNNNYVGRGSFALKYIACDRYVSGTWTDNSFVSTSNTTNTFIVYVVVVVTEPLIALSPWLAFEHDQQGITGIRQANFTFSMSDTSRLLSSSLTTISSVTLGVAKPFFTGGSAALTQNAFTNTQFLFCHKELQPTELAKINNKQILPYYVTDYLPYSPNSSSTLVSGASISLTSSNISLSVIPDKFIIAVRPQLGSQNWNNSASFFKINSISILFSSQSGLLASLNQQQLFELSKKNGYEGSYSEWVGFANGAVVATTTGQSLIPTTGGVLFINPAYDLRLPAWYSNSSQGNFNFVITINVTNQSATAYVPEIIICYYQSGIMICEDGNTSTSVGVLRNENVLDTRLQEPLITSHEYENEIGGSLDKRGKTAKLFRKKTGHIKKISGGGDVGGAMGLSLDGAGNSGGLSRHIRKR